MKRINFLIIFSILCFGLQSQTLVMNEVSNGPSGNKEYVEFVVVDTTVAYNCTTTTVPPCIDIRGWIFDDNSGWHGGPNGPGVAPGCLRFSYNSVWSCLPVGTILLIYNDADFDAAALVPPIDTLMNDGNCRLIVPVSKSNWFDRNATTPGDVACSYPATGWVPTSAGTWSYTFLANAGDCARIVNTSGCEVFSVCWGGANTFGTIYFSGSASQLVYYFANTVNNHATNQANWISACASTTCSNQTPGAPNNVANAAWIHGLNNNCTPIPPMSASIAATNGSCGCSSGATVNASGSLPPYTYTWFPNPGSGQGTPTVGGLCSGTYTCVIKSTTTKCTETLITTVSGGTTGTSASNTGSYCAGATIQLNTSSANSYTWSGPGGFTSSAQNPTIASSTTSMSGIYTVNVIMSGCSATATTMVTVNSSPTLSASSASICLGLTATLSASGANSYTWNPGSVTGANYTTSPASSSTYTVIGAVGSCTAAKVASVTVGSSISISVNNPTMCIGSGSVTINAAGATTYTWSTGSNNSSISVNPSVTTVYTVSGTNASCNGNNTSTVTVNPTPTVATADGSLCSGQTITLSANGANSYTWNPGANTGSSITVSPSSSQSYTVIGTSALGCTNSAVSTITVSQTPTLAAASQTICAGQTATLSASGATSYTWNPGGVNAATFTVSPGSSFIYTVSGSDLSCFSSIAVTLGVIPDLILDVNNATICVGQTTTLNANGAATYVWLNGPSTASYVVSPTVTAIYTVTGSSGNCSKDTSAQVIVNSLPVAPSVSVNSAICQGGTINLSGNGVAGSYVWLGPNSYTASGITATILPAQLSNAGSYTLAITDANGCVNRSTISVSIGPSPIATVSSQTTCVGKPLILESAGGSSYSWNGPSGFSSSSATVTIAESSSTMSGTYSVTVTNTSGCVSTNTLAVLIEKCACEVFVPEGFSPNADGAHDQFIISCIDEHKVKIEIFNRWGNLVYKSNDYQNNWDGKSNAGFFVIGEELPAGTYYYIIQVSDEEKARTGFVTLWR
jgi:gliding motility-associated-like protein